MSGVKSLSIELGFIILNKQVTYKILLNISLLHFRYGKVYSSNGESHVG